MTDRELQKLGRRELLQLLLEQATEPGHRHGESCYAEREERELTCGLEETEGHRHDGGCYTAEEERTLICGQSEAQGHEHGSLNGAPPPRMTWGMKFPSS